MTKFHKKIALITGVHGMDGSHLSDYLISLGYTVYGL
jgi:GDP-D-mannose dehydratase